MRAEAVLELDRLEPKVAVFHGDWEFRLDREDWQELGSPDLVTVAVWAGDVSGPQNTPPK